MKAKKKKRRKKEKKKRKKRTEDEFFILWFVCIRGCYPGMHNAMKNIKKSEKGKNITEQT